MSGTYSHKSTLKKKKYYQKKQKSLIRMRIALILFIVLVIFSSYSLRKTYISHKCKNLTYAIDYYFTNYKNKNLRLLGVENITLLKNNENKATIEVTGLSYTTPRYKQTLVGKFKKNEDGSWKMYKVSDTQ